ncbi:MAG: MBL fold metallo-hydrolase [Lachnospiraceae bacterium]|nr:MBL fold metallo-hydrolase [Lachnospiraceae bacterium]
MIIRNLIENTEGANACTPQHGLSFYIETKRHKILSDFGPGEDMLANAEKLGIDLKQVDIAVLSHGHYDHSGGLPAFARLNPDAAIYLHAKADKPYYSFDGKEKGYRYIGIAPEIMALKQVRLLSDDFVIDDELSVFGNLTGCMEKQIAAGNDRRIPATNRYLMIKEGETYIKDDFSHEQCLVIREDGKCVLISGCAHSGILNILDRYEEIHHSLPDAVVSGFHLMKKKDYTEDECDEIRAIARELTTYPTRFYTCHCTGLAAYEMLKEIMGDQLSYVHCGDEVIV